MTPPVTADDVRRIASLARLAISDEYAEELRKDLNAILAHMEALSGVNADGVPKPQDLRPGMRLREDRGPAIPLEESPESFVPDMTAGLIRVPRLATHVDHESA